jgi:ABC-type transport system involved in cytochrome bd biosynthesis fused ATPase/permease subunit
MATTCLFLQCLPVKISFSRQVRNSGREIAHAEAESRTKTSEQRPAQINVRVQDLRLWIDKLIFKRSTGNILQGITAEFEPGNLNVIMGPSGITTVNQSLQQDLGKVPY